MKHGWAIVLGLALIGLALWFFVLRGERGPMNVGAFSAAAPPAPPPVSPGTGAAGTGKPLNVATVASYLNGAMNTLGLKTVATAPRQPTQVKSTFGLV